MARLRGSKFRFATENEVLECIAEAEREIHSLRITLDVLRNRRNKFLAHISPELVFKPETLRRAKSVTMPQIREVLYAGGNIVNRFLCQWSHTTNQLLETHSDDYKKIISLVSKQLCAEIKAHEAEFAAHGALDKPLPRPRDCK
jgi:hypothetical protein